MEKLEPGHLVDWVKGIGNLDVAPLEHELVSKLKQSSSGGHLVDWVKGIGNLDVAPLEHELVSKLKQIKTEYQALNKSKTMNREKI